jgi:cyclopropane fatty-acyl-phospholipid synthase-like methyltransferase
MPTYDDARAAWDQRFAKAEGFLFGSEPNRFLAAEAHRLKPGQRVLCLADGEGRNGTFLAGRGQEVLSIDISPVALAKARALAAERGVVLEFEEANLADWTWPIEAFDAVVAIFIQFAGPGLRSRIFRNIEACLNPGGLLLIEGYRPEQLAYGTGGPPDAENMYTEALLREAFAGMEILSLRAYDAAIAEGTAHKGMSALIDMVAAKRR